MTTYPGAPLTPGVGATENAKRLDIKRAATITRVPVLPIPFGDALPLLKALGGPMAPNEWKGLLPISYWLKVHLKLEFNWNLETIYDVIAMMPGSERPGQWILRRGARYFFRRRSRLGLRRAAGVQDKNRDSRCFEELSQ